MRQCLTATSFALALAFLFPTTSSSIVIRHDRDPQAYLDLGARFPAVCQIGGRMGDGTLVGPDWILTAAHVARGLAESSDPTVRCNDRTLGVVAVYVHTDFRPMGPHDFALLRLAEPVAGIEPLSLYDADQETGATAVLVGHGATGFGDRRDRSEDGRRRAATNVVEEVGPDHLRFHFDAPPGGTELEGIPGPGDSGGPALLELDGRFVVIGVSSLGEPGGNGPGTYGANDYFGRVSTHLEWLRGAMQGRVPEYRPSAPVLPDSVAGERMAALLQLLDDGSPAGIEAFVADHMTDDPDRRARRIDALRQLIESFGGAELSRVNRAGPTEIGVVVRTREGRRLLGLRLEATPPHRIEGIMTGQP